MKWQNTSLSDPDLELLDCRLFAPDGAPFATRANKAQVKRQKRRTFDPIALLCRRICEDETQSSAE